MSFWNIKDHEKRDAMIEDYLATVKHIQQRSENEKLGSLARQKILEETYRPVIRSQQEASKEIVKGLLPIKDEVVNLRQTLEPESAGPSSSKKRREELGGLGEEAIRFVMRNKIHDRTLDRTFGIKFTVTGYVIGNTPVRFQGNDIIIGNVEYPGTPGLWALITDTQKEQIAEAKPSDEDYDNYQDIVQNTHVLYENSDPNSERPRSNSSWKWNRLLKPIWRSMKEEGEEEEEEEEKEGEGEKEPEKSGEGLFLKRNGEGLYLAQKRRSGGGVVAQHRYFDLMSRLKNKYLT